MPTGMVDLAALVRSLADRRAGRTEANVQSDVHRLLTAAPLQLDDHQLEDIVLESPAGQRRRIDVEVGYTVIEVKRDLRVGNVRAEAIDQLAGYVRARTVTMRQRYVGVLTDGAEWHAYQLVDDNLQLASSLVLDPAGPNVDGLIVWLEGVLATVHSITPTPREIARRLGAGSPAHALDALELAALYDANRELPGVALKRRLWAKLLTTALGTAFGDEDELFVEHTLLVLTAEIIAHAVAKIDPTSPDIAASALVSGALFEQAQIGGVVESDFFDWVVEVPDGERFVRALARRLARFDWGGVEHDVMKVLYESVIAPDTRHQLGEYYTPDWLADEIVTTVVTDPLHQRALDPSCGSGTFLFHAVRHYLGAAEAAGLPVPETISAVTRHVVGMDVHPVAVTLARVTYLLAIGMDRLARQDRPAFTVPVYLGDSLQWGQEANLLSHNALVVSTDSPHMFAQELRFPDRLLADAGRFDQLVGELTERATNRQRHSPVPSLTGVFRRFAVHPDDEGELAATFATMCELHDEERNHIWGYYVRNLARPIWLSHRQHRVDVLFGNPPWLAYRHMTGEMQARFRVMSRDRNLWAGRTVTPSEDLSGLFVVRAVELYLRDGGRFAFVMPLAALSRKQFAGFRAADYSGASQRLAVAFDQPWDLHAVKPSFFPVPASVVFGSRTPDHPRPLTAAPEGWVGRLPQSNATRADASPHLTRGTSQPKAHASEAVSPYAGRFSQGATVVPKMLLVVEPQSTSALGVGAGRRAVRSRRSALEKPPWRDLPSLTGTVETQFIRPLYVGDTVLPYRTREPALCVVPWDGERLLHGNDDRIDQYPGLAQWWRQAEGLWRAHRSSNRLDLLERLDFRRGLREQFPLAPHRVVYSASGMYLAAARVSDPAAIIEHKLYWAAVADVDEARFLTAVFNSDTLTTLVRPLQARGEHNPRDFDKYIFRLAIPVYDTGDSRHRHLAELAARAEQVAAGLDLPDAGLSFQALRRRVRQALDDDGVGWAIEQAVAELNLVVYDEPLTAVLPAEDRG